MKPASRVILNVVAALCGLLIPLVGIGLLFNDFVGAANLAIAALATIGPLAAVRLTWEYRALAAGLKSRALLPVPAAVPVGLSVASLFPVILIISSLQGWPSRASILVALPLYLALQWFATTRGWHVYQTKFERCLAARASQPPAA